MIRKMAVLKKTGDAYDLHNYPHVMCCRFTDSASESVTEIETSKSGPQDAGLNNLWPFI